MDDLYSKAAYEKHMPKVTELPEGYTCAIEAGMVSHMMGALFVYFRDKVFDQSNSAGGAMTGTVTCQNCGSRVEHPDHVGLAQHAVVDESLAKSR